MTRNSQSSLRKASLIATLMLAGVPVFAEENASAMRIVVSIPDHKLALLDGDRVVRVFPVAVGKPSTPSPEGQFQVVTRLAHPTWYHAGKVVGPGKANPLGTRWLGLSVKGYGIHGTNVPSSIGKHASHGCIRMRNEDVEALFALVTLGVRVELVGSPDEALRKTFTFAD